jgi:hypothetical protein
MIPKGTMDRGFTAEVVVRWHTQDAGYSLFAQYQSSGKLIF